MPVTLSTERMERVAGAVDDVTDTFGLNAGEAIFTFTTMLLITMRDMPTDVRAVLVSGVVDSLRADSMLPLGNVLHGERKVS